VRVRITWQLRKQKVTGAIEATCSAWTHQFGYELRLDVDGSCIRSQVARSNDEILTAQEEWRAAMWKRLAVDHS
jgi:hypothetical protein